MAKFEIDIKEGESGSRLVTPVTMRSDGFRTLDVQNGVERALKKLSVTYIIETTITSEGLRVSWRPVTDTGDHILDPEAPDDVDVVIDSETAAKPEEDVYDYLDRRYEELSETVAKPEEDRD